MIKVTDYIFRGPRPQSFKELQDAGIKYVVNLESGVYDELHKDAYDTEDPTQFGITLIRVPCSDICPPSYDQVMRALQPMYFCQNKGAHLYVHCLHGEDRTGFVVAAFRMKLQGWTFGDAVKEMLSLGFHKFPYLWWVPFLKQYQE